MKICHMIEILLFIMHLPVVKYLSRTFFMNAYIIVAFSGCIECVQLILESSQAIRYVYTVKPIIIIISPLNDREKANKFLQFVERFTYLLTYFVFIQFYFLIFIKNIGT